MSSANDLLSTRIYKLLSYVIYLCNFGVLRYSVHFPSAFGIVTHRLLSSVQCLKLLLNLTILIIKKQMLIIKEVLKNLRLVNHREGDNDIPTNQLHVIHQHNNEKLIIYVMFTLFWSPTSKCTDYLDIINMIYVCTV